MAPHSANGHQPLRKVYYIARIHATDCGAIHECHLHSTNASRRREARLKTARWRYLLVGALFAPCAALAGIAAQEPAAQKSVFYCAGTTAFKTGYGMRAVDRTTTSAVVLELEAERLVLIGNDTTSALNILRVEKSDTQTIYHFGGIAGEFVYKGSFTVPEFRLRVLGTGDALRIEIRMDCDGTSPLRLF